MIRDRGSIESLSILKHLYPLIKNIGRLLLLLLAIDELGSRVGLWLRVRTKDSSDPVVYESVQAVDVLL